MTDYQLIKSELNSLGWKETPGRGDHFKFRKDGADKAISVSMSVRSNGRSFANLIADIRKMEPDFVFGRPAKSKKEIEKKLRRLSPEQEKLRRRWAFIAPGEKVRYVTPENRDYGLLDSPESVMNHEYVVTDIVTDAPDGLVASSEDIVTIKGDDGQEIVVKPSDVECWTLHRCHRCGRDFPESDMTDNLCDQCEAAASAFLSSVAKDFEHIFKERLNKILDMMPKDVRGILLKNGGPEFKKMVSENVKLYETSLDVRWQIVWTLYMQDMSIKKIAEDAMIKKEEEKKNRECKPKNGSVKTVESTRTPYSCWMACLNYLEAVIKLNCCGFYPNPYSKTKARKTLHGISYSCDTIRKGETGLDVLTIVVPDANRMPEIILTHISVIQSFFVMYYKDRPFCTRIVCKGADLDDFFVMPGDEGHALDSMRVILGEDAFDENCEGARTFAGFPGIGKLEEEVMDVLRELVHDGVIPETDFVKMIDKTTPDENTVGLFVNYLPESSEKESGLERYFRPKLRLLLYLKNPDTEEAMINNAADLRDRILRAHAEWRDLEIALVRYSDDLAPWLQCAFETSFHRVVAPLPESGRNQAAEAETIKETEKNVTMTETQTPAAGCCPLDSVNPDSSVECLRCVTTRELLRELRSRGVTFEKVSVPVIVKQEINIEDI